LIAYQIAFDIEESAKQEYLQKLLKSLPAVEVDPSEMDTEKSEDPMQKIRHILSGELSIKLYLEFLYRNNKADLLILKNTKNALDSRNSVFHSGVTFANAFMNAGTTSDEFLRQNLDWLSRASNWTKFSATAALGVIHKVKIDLALKLGPHISGPNIAITLSSTAWRVVVLLFRRWITFRFRSY
jgi:26S proteasome regulatory subunit N2